MQDPPINKPLGQPFTELKSIDSTNNYALGQARDGTGTHGSAYFAHDQTAGKGQRNKIWTAQKGASINLSILVKPSPLLLSQQFQWSACIAVAVQQFFAVYAGKEIKIKWPNDLYWADKKAGGILIENIIGGKPPSIAPAAIKAGLQTTNKELPEWKWSVAGIGINVNQSYFPPELPNPVSLYQITGKLFDPKALSHELCAVVNTWYQRLLKDGFEPVFREYENSLYKLHEDIKLVKDQQEIRRTLTGVSRTGELITFHEGIEERFRFGEVGWLASGFNRNPAR